MLDGESVLHLVLDVGAGVDELGEQGSVPPVEIVLIDGLHFIGIGSVLGDRGTDSNDILLGVQEVFVH